jgi:hypothetical protein
MTDQRLLMDDKELLLRNLEKKEQVKKVRERKRASMEEL